MVDLRRRGAYVRVRTLRTYAYVRVQMLMYVTFFKKNFMYVYVHFLYVYVHNTNVQDICNFFVQMYICTKKMYISTKKMYISTKNLCTRTYAYVRVHQSYVHVLSNYLMYIQCIYVQKVLRTCSK